MNATLLPGGRVAGNGGANPTSGYRLVEATDTDAAMAFAGQCPILADGGSVAVARCFDI